MPIPLNPSVPRFQAQANPAYRESEFKKGLRTAADSVAPDFRRTVALGASVLGFDDFSQQQRAEAQRIEKENHANAVANAPRIGSLREVDNINDLVDLAAYQIGSSTPTMASMALGGAGGKVLGRVAGLGSRGSNVAATAAAAAPYAMSVGGQLSRDIVDDPNSTASYEDRNLAAFGGTALSTALGMSPLAGVASRVMRPSTSVGSRVAQGALTGGVLEGATEAGEELVGKAFHRTVNPDVTLGERDDWWDYADAAFGGAALGAPMGGAAGLAAAARAKITSAVEDGDDPQSAAQRFVDENKGVLDQSSLDSIYQDLASGSYVPGAPRSRLQRRMDDMEADDALDMAYSQVYGRTKREMDAARKVERDKYMERLTFAATELINGADPQDAHIADIVKADPRGVMDRYQEIVQGPPSVTSGYETDMLSEEDLPDPRYVLNQRDEGWKPFDPSYGGDYETDYGAEKARYSELIKRQPKERQAELLRVIDPKAPIQYRDRYASKQEEMAAGRAYLRGDLGGVDQEVTTGDKERFWGALTDPQKEAVKKRVKEAGGRELAYRLNEASRPFYKSAPPSTTAHVVDAGQIPDSPDVGEGRRNVVRVQGAPRVAADLNARALPVETIFGDSPLLAKQAKREFRQQVDYLNERLVEEESALDPDAAWAASQLRKKAYESEADKAGLEEVAATDPKLERVQELRAELENAKRNLRNADRMGKPLIVDRAYDRDAAEQARKQLRQIKVKVKNQATGKWVDKAIDPMEVAIAMQRNAKDNPNLAFDPNDPIRSAINQVTEGLSSVLTHPNVEVRLDGEPDPNTVVYTSKSTGVTLRWKDLAVGQEYAGRKGLVIGAMRDDMSEQREAAEMERYRYVRDRDFDNIAYREIKRMREERDVALENGTWPKKGTRERVKADREFYREIDRLQKDMRKGDSGEYGLLDMPQEIDGQEGDYATVRGEMAENDPLTQKGGVQTDPGRYGVHAVTADERKEVSEDKREAREASRVELEKGRAGRARGERDAMRAETQKLSGYLAKLEARKAAAEKAGKFDAEAKASYEDLKGKAEKRLEHLKSVLADGLAPRSKKPGGGIPEQDALDRWKRAREKWDKEHGPAKPPKGALPVDAPNQPVWAVVEAKEDGVGNLLAAFTSVSMATEYAEKVGGNLVNDMLDNLRGRLEKSEVEAGRRVEDREYVVKKDNPTRRAAHQKLAERMFKALGLKGKVRILGADEALRLAEAKGETNYFTLNGFTVLRNGENVVYVNPALGEKAAFEVLGHELGHIVLNQTWDDAPKAAKESVMEAYENWLMEHGHPMKRLRDVYESRFASNLFDQARALVDSDVVLGELSVDRVEAITAFKEWFSDQVSRWMTTEAKPLSLAEKLFKHAADVIRDMFGLLKKGGAVRADATVKSYMDGMFRAPLDTFADIASPLEKSTIEEAAAGAFSPDWSKAKHIRRITSLLHSMATPLHKDELNALGRMAQGNHVRRQLYEIYAGDPGALALLDAYHTEGSVGLAYAAWVSGELDVSKGTDSILRKFVDAMRKALGVVTDEQNAEAVMEAVLGAMPDGRESVVRTRVNDTAIQQARQFVEKLAAPAVRVAGKVFESAEGRIRATNNAALMEMWRQVYIPPDAPGGREPFFAARNHKRAQFEEALHKFYDGKDAEFGRRVIGLLQEELPMDSATEEEKTAVRKTRALLRGIHDYAKNAGVKFGDLGTDYFPRIWDIDVLQKRSDEFSGMLVDKYADYLVAFRDENGLSRDLEAKDVADLITRGLITAGGEQTSAVDNVLREAADEVDGDPLGWPKNDRIKERKLKFIDPEDAAPFLNKDLGDTMSSYINQMVKRAEYNRRFGKFAGHRTVNAYLEEARRTGASEKDIETATDAMKAAFGTLGIDINPKVHKIQGALMVMENWMLLGMATLTSLADPVGIAVRGDIETAWASLKQGLREVKASARGEETDLSRMAQSLGINELHNTLDALGYEYGGYYVTGAARKWNDRLFRFNLLQSWTRGTRTMALAGAKHFLEKHGSMEFNAHSSRYMHELGLRKGDVKLDKNGNLALLSFAERKKLSDEGGETASAELARDTRVRVALNRWVDEAILRPDAAQRPIWASDPHWMLVFHLKAFMYSFHERILRRVGEEVMNGRYNASLAMLGYLPVMLVAEGLRNTIQGDDMDDVLGEDAGLFATSHYLAQRSGLYGPLQMAFDAKQGWEYGDTPFSTMGGPILEHVLDISEAIMTEKTSDDEYAAWRSLPLNNVYKDWF